MLTRLRYQRAKKCRRTDRQTAFQLYIYRLCVYHQITCVLFLLRYQLKRLHLDKQYQRTVPLNPAKGWHMSGFLKIAFVQEISMLVCTFECVSAEDILLLVIWDFFNT